MAASTESYMHLDQSAFNYDYETLQTTGVILAMIMFVSGILIALNPVQWKALSHQRQKFHLRQYKEDVCVRCGGPFRREEMLKPTKLLTGMWRRLEPA
ncbi:FXYD domain containing ion transport regulator 7 isoform X2 [Xyrauchen texanus]|uniref:FXYD domain containing ion transport regulator 7 isoform X2 n=1 Tax=Xyrauchen texanus TaxID=154827 RepID=UPI002242B336|nr:FXYD domain containing ion transport regulator 7 isoform X2 [Xyrauchen texanus]